MNQRANFQATLPIATKRKKKAVLRNGRQLAAALPSLNEADARLARWAERECPWLTPDGLAALEDAPELCGPADRGTSYARAA
jgi:hypothetical protein